MKAPFPVPDRFRQGLPPMAIVPIGLDGKAVPGEFATVEYHLFERHAAIFAASCNPCAAGLAKGDRVAVVVHRGTGSEDFGAGSVLEIETVENFSGGGQRTCMFIQLDRMKILEAGA